MSIKCTSRVWDHSAASGTELLVLLAISDHAHEDGTGAYPSVDTLATKCKISRRSVQRYLKNLSENGELKIEYGKGRNGTNMYTVLSGLLPANSKQEMKRICYMCSCEESEDNILDAHHRVPGDDDTLIDLCRSCHVRLHQLIGTDIQSLGTDAGGDRLTPPTHRGDKMGEGGDVSGSSGVTGVSPKPSVNRQEPSVKRDSSDKHTEWDKFLLAWARHFPHKIQPRVNNLTLRKKLMVRLKDIYFRENYETALMQASGSDFVNSGNWMDAGWFLKNEENWEKCLDGKYDNNDKPKQVSKQQAKKDATKQGLYAYLKKEGVIVDE